jgi:hypothetical protein
MRSHVLIGLFTLALSLVAAPHVARAAALPHCSSGDPVVWVNTRSHVFHRKGDKYYGATKAGEYACESAAVAGGSHLAGTKSAPMSSAASGSDASSDASPAPSKKMKKHHAADASPAP